ncbi:transglycosylase/D,D-transpeptidase PonA1 [Paractinoplanes ferrugineus]|uniref:Penicillin-binding protein 1A n=1 Tax=Paractinoplanes ferrugineus TaxID=113564 RepID=A0A919MDK2_9ACTN|nr:transglycosylase domain-containing protein [Actinoplanes ferrugineus]GIE11838.1 penicillin-binding protein 1A [Actinoplanes ferrugineus]
MNPYGDPQSPRARASVPGAGASAPDDQSAGPSPDAYRRGAGGRASVGSASVGSASVGSASAGRASVGGAPVGSASVGGVAGSARVGARASVGAGTGSVGGRASVARAAVRPGTATPGGPPNAPVPGGKDKKSKAAKRRRRTNILTAAAAVVVIMLGAGVVGGTYFFDDVALPPPVTENQQNAILYSNGALIEKVGDQNRTVVPEDKISDVVEKAVAGAEDKNFYNHHGIDMKGIVRAAWNNFTGGATQGASTITQQYARHAADLKAISINRKLREAVIARKLESQYDKEQIMGMYLNYVDFGEGRYGIEAAALGYFGKSVTTPPGQKNAVTPYEAAVLASIIKQPYKTGSHPGYDPNDNIVNGKVGGPALERWEYTMKNMLDMNWISQDVYDKRAYPKVKPRGAKGASSGAADKPVGMVTRHVMAELNSMGISDQEFEQGGLTITTTIDPKVQKAAEEAGSQKSDDSPMNGLNPKYQAAVIGIDPTNGRVLGYYGGDTPSGLDYGGYMSANGKEIVGGQSPGSTMKIYTLAAGLKEGVSFDSLWNGDLKRRNGTKISNAGADPGKVCGGKIKYCDLETATIKSYNFPFYWITDTIGPEKVIEAAKAAGVKHMITDEKAGFKNGEIIDLTKTDKSTWRNSFDNEVGFGQYRIPPLEHAEGVATIVGQGVHHNAHFIKTVKRTDPESGKVTVVGQENIKGNRVFEADQMSNLSAVMKKIVEVDNRDLKGGREGIAKSGTWEYQEGSGDCWFVGGTPQIAATVWVGGKGNKVQLKERDGKKDMFGAGTPSKIWKMFLDTASSALDLKNEDFPARIKTGDPSKFGNGEKPPEAPVNNDCALAVIGLGCGNNGGQNNGGQNDGGQNNGGQNNGGPNNGGNNGGQNNGGQNNGGPNNGGNGGGPGNGGNGGGNGNTGDGNAAQTNGD